MPHDGDGEAPQTITFGHYTVDLGARVVEHHGTPVSLEPQVFDVLAVLIEHRERVVTKIELLDRVWGDRFVSPATLTSRIRDLRRALGDSGRTQHVIKTAHARGFRFVAAVDPAPHAAARHSPMNPARRSLTPLLGREDELEHVRLRLKEARLVTVVGPGGVGKTHLVRHVAADLKAPVAELLDVRNADALRHAVLESIGGVQRPDVDTTEALVQMLDGRDTVLVLDNCEHVIGDVASLVRELLHACSGLRILTTSRRPLALSAESVVRLGSLTPDAAVELMIGCAARHGVELGTQRHDLVVDICERLDCLPLALELAASKTRALPLGEIRRLLDERLTMLTSDSSDAADHHSSLDHAIRWSGDLLPASQRRLLAALSVFVGPFDLAAVRAVCTPEGTPDTDIVADLIALTDVSLVAFDSTLDQYRLLESIRMFAASLGADPDVPERFRAHVLATLEAAGELHAATFSTGMAAIASSWASARWVAGTAQHASDAATLHRLIAATTRYAEQTFAFELLNWIAAATSIDERAGTTTPPSTHLAAALLLIHRSDFETAARHLPRTTEADPALRQLALLWHCYFTGDLAGADAARIEIRRLVGGTGNYAESVATVAGQFLDKGAQRPFDPDDIAVLDAWAGGDDEALAIGAALCAALRLDWDHDATIAVEQLTGLVDDARRRGLAFLASGASTARSIALAVSPEAETSARVLRATLRSYADIGAWQFALADFAATALTLALHDRAVAAAELLGARRASGYVGDASDDIAAVAAEEARGRLGRKRFADSLRQGTARDPATATRLALAALADIIGDLLPLRGRNSDGRDGNRTGNTGHQRSLAVNNGHSKT